MSFFRRLTKDKVHKKYKFLEDLGSGAFAVVKKAVNRKTKQEVAIKVIKKKTLGEALHLLEREIDILQRIDHPNIIKLYEIFDTKDKIYLVMELVTGGEVFDDIVEKEYYFEKETAFHINKILQALKYLHSMGIAHRDLKPENLLYSSDSEDREIKIADFGLSKIYDVEDGSVLETACGTPGYVAPEVLEVDKRGQYGFEVDVWSVGVICYIMLCGYPPFSSESMPVLFNMIKKGKYEFPPEEWDDISDEAKDLIRRMLTVNPKKRITVDEALEHPWIKKYNKD